MADMAAPFSRYYLAHPQLQRRCEVTLSLQLIGQTAAKSLHKPLHDGVEAAAQKTCPFVCLLNFLHVGAPSVV